MRIRPLVFVLVATTAACVLAEGPSSAPSEFSSARSAHKTRLRKEGPSPQPFHHEQPPQGVTEIHYPSGDLKLMAWLTDDPNDNKKHAALVYVHGGFAFGRDDFDETEPYRSAGFVVMTPTLRGENGNPGHFEWAYGEVDDVIAAGRYLASLPYVDAKHVFVAGHSSGGQNTILAALVSPTPFAAAAPIGGYVNMDVFTHSAQWRRVIPFDPDDAAEAKLRSADQFLSSLQIPVTFYVGKQDAGAHSGLDAFVRRATDAGKRCDKVELAGDHFESKPQAIRQSADWFRKLAGE